MDLNRYALTALGEQVHVAAWPAISAMTADPNSANFDNITEAAIKYHALAAQAYVMCRAESHRRGCDRADRSDRPA